MAFAYPINMSDSVARVAVLTASSTVILTECLFPYLANAKRKKLIILNPINNVGNNLLLTFSSTDLPNKATFFYSVRLAPGEKYEDTRQTPYQGQVNAQFDTSNAFCNVTNEE